MMGGCVPETSLDDLLCETHLIIYSLGVLLLSFKL